MTGTPSAATASSTGIQSINRTPADTLIATSTRTPPAPVPIPTRKSSPTANISVFSSKTWSDNRPEDITPVASHFFGMGFEPICGLDSAQKPYFLVAETNITRFTKAWIVTCGWMAGEVVTVKVKLPNGSEKLVEQVVPINSEARGYTFQPSFGDPLGLYKITFEGESGIVEAPLQVSEPEYAGLFELESNEYLLSGFLPNEQVRLLVYNDKSFFAWQKFEVDSEGNLIIAIEEQSNNAGRLEYFAIGEKSKNWDSEHVTIFCPDAPPTRLGIGISARVGFSNGKPLKIRSEPGLSGEVLSHIAEGTEIYNLEDGPICVDDIIWWYTGYGGGWVAEGQDGEYFLEPWGNFP